MSKNDNGGPKERPILFSAPMVQAIKANQKSQTRRVVKKAGEVFHDFNGVGDAVFHDAATANKWNTVRCPYGQVGDILWVRESVWQWGRWADNGKTPAGLSKRKFVPIGEHVVYVADCEWYPREEPDLGRIIHADEQWIKRPGIFMPRWACRIRLQLTERRVEHLRDISETDAIAEGVERAIWHNPYTKEDENYWTGYMPGCRAYRDTAVESFLSLFDSINGKGSSDANPYVWALTFKRIESEVSTHGAD